MPEFGTLTDIAAVMDGNETLFSHKAPQEIEKHS